jgi:hypothetical protein
VHTGYRIASVLVLLLASATYAASTFGWGLSDDASVRAKSVRQGSLRGRHYLGGGPGYGK